MAKPQSNARTVSSVRILGIDPGTLHCGYAVIETGGATVVRPRYVECGVIEMSAQLSLPQRLLVLARDLREVIGELEPDEVSLEAAFHGKNAQSALRLGHARGAIMLVAAEAKLPLAEYPPATVKRTVAGHGRADKTEIQRIVTYLCSLKKVPSPDAADALAIAICHAYHSAAPALLRRAQDGARTRRTQPTR